ncbi:hypothetical protein D9M73_239660 [compost metagenome]
MNEQELLNAITANLPELRCELTPGEFFFEIGMDGSSFLKEVEVLRTLRSNSFRQRLRETGFDFLFYRTGKLEFVEVTHV